MADKFGPIFTIRMGVHPAVVVSNWEMAKECLTTHDRVFADRPATIAMDLLGYQRSMVGFSPYGPYWRKIRKIATLELLSSHRLQLLRHVREAEVNVAIKELYGYWCSNERNGVVTVEMDSWFGDIALNVILKMIVGKSIGYLTAGEDGVRLKKLLKSFFELSGRFVVADGVPYLRWMDVGGFEKEMRKTAEEMDVVIVGWLKEHKDKRDSGGGVKAAEDDFMDVILNLLGDEGAIMDRDSDTVNKATSLVLFYYLQSLILAGADTTTVTMTWLLSLLVNHPDVLSKAQIELVNIVGYERQVQESDLHNLVYLNAIVKETLRLYPPGPLAVPHQAMEDCTVAGHLVRKGTRLITNISKIQRDPRVWSEADKFQPDRFLSTHKDMDLKDKDIDVKGQNFELIPFGSGRRMCPGLNFALQVMYLTMATLLHGFDFSRATSEPVDMRESIGLTNPRASPLEVVLNPRLPPHLYG
ncbi:Demethylepipodophyllotoxin synthase [Linum perenne]